MSENIDQLKGRLAVMERRLALAIEKKRCAETSAVASEQRAAKVFLENGRMKKQIEQQKATINCLRV